MDSSCQSLCKIFLYCSSIWLALSCCRCTSGSWLKGLLDVAFSTLLGCSKLSPLNSSIDAGKRFSTSFKAATNKARHRCLTSSIFASLLNRVPCVPFNLLVPSCPKFRRALVPSMLACPRALVPACPNFWRALVPSMFSCPRALIFGVPSCLPCWRALVPSCPHAQIIGVPSCLPCWRALVPACPNFQRASCLQCWRALVPSCLRAQIFGVPSCLCYFKTMDNI